MFVNKEIRPRNLSRTRNPAKHAARLTPNHQPPNKTPHTNKIITHPTYTHARAREQAMLLQEEAIIREFELGAATGERTLVVGVQELIQVSLYS